MEWPKAANSEQAMAMATASPALPTLACRSMPESGATNATRAGGAARVGCGSSASLDTIKTNLRGCRLYDTGPPLFRLRDVTSNRCGVTMATYAPAASSAPDDLVARRRTPLPDGGGRRQHVEIRSPAGAYLRGERALSQSIRRAADAKRRHRQIRRVAAGWIAAPKQPAIRRLPLPIGGQIRAQPGSGQPSAPRARPRRATALRRAARGCWWWPAATAPSRAGRW